MTTICLWVALMGHPTTSDYAEQQRIARRPLTEEGYMWEVPHLLHINRFLDFWSRERQRLTIHERCRIMMEWYATRVDPTTWPLPRVFNHK